MCLCARPSPIYIRPDDYPQPFLNDVFGYRLADNIRSLFGPRLHPDSPYGYICSCGGDSYLSAALSSVWAFLVVVIAFTAGITFPFKRRTAWWMLGVGGAISLLDAGLRFGHRYARYPADIRELMISWLPGQIVADVVFQFAVPFGVGLAIALLTDGVRSLLVIGLARLKGA